MTPFRNEPLLELRRQAVRREALAALAALDAKLPLEVPMLIGDAVVEGRRFASVDPSQPTRIVAHAGFRVRAYCPVGELVAGMAYLVRRLLENTANESFLSDLQRGMPIEELLAAP